MEPNSEPRGMVIDLAGPHVRAAAIQANLTMEDECASEPERLLAQTFLMSLQTRMVHLSTLIYFARKSGEMMDWPVEMPSGEIGVDLYAPYIASGEDPHNPAIYGQVVPLMAAWYRQN